MADNLNTDGNIEVYPGPRGFSVVDAKGDGTNVRFVTDEPRTLNPVALPRGPQGDRGPAGAPGEASIRVDETIGYRVFLWHPATAAEQMVYGDTGVRRLADGSIVRRVGAQVETTATDTTTLPAGFRPTIDGNRPMFTTADPWPAELPGTKVTDPAKMLGLEDYAAAVSNGYPGTAEQWLNDKYRVLPDPAKVPQGHVLTRTTTGLAYAPLPQIGPGPWRNITLQNWKVVSHLGSRAQTRLNNSNVEWYGHITYTGPTVEAGMWSDESVRIGVVSPQDAPLFNMERPIVTYDGATGAGRPVPARLNITDKGVVQVMCYSRDGAANTLTLKSGVTQIGLTGISYPARNQ